MKVVAPFSVIKRPVPLLCQFFGASNASENQVMAQRGEQGYTYDLRIFLLKSFKGSFSEEVTSLNDIRRITLPVEQAAFYAFFGCTIYLLLIL